MKHKVSELTGALLDAAVAKAEGFALDEAARSWFRGDGAMILAARFSPSADWAQGGPIIDSEQITVLSPDVLGPPATLWRAEIMGTLQPGWEPATAFGSSALIAAMRAHVIRKFGELIEL